MSVSFPLKLCLHKVNEFWITYVTVIIQTPLIIIKTQL